MSGVPLLAVGCRQVAALADPQPLLAPSPLAQVCLKYYEYEFMELACQCPAVVCCRCAPTQKAQIVRLLQERTGKLTCAVGKLAWVVGGAPRKEEEPARAVVRLAWVVAVSRLRPCPAGPVL